MNRWLRLGLQTALGLALLWLWLRTVSLPEILSHARVHNWWVVAVMLLLALTTSVIRARRWLILLRPLAPVGMVRAFAMNAGASLLRPRSSSTSPATSPAWRSFSAGSRWSPRPVW